MKKIKITTPIILVLSQELVKAKYALSSGINYPAKAINCL